jgi:hypothetical protein
MRREGRADRKCSAPGLGPPRAPLGKRERITPSPEDIGHRRTRYDFLAPRQPEARIARLYRRRWRPWWPKAGNCAATESYAIPNVYATTTKLGNHASWVGLGVSAVQKNLQAVTDLTKGAHFFTHIYFCKAVKPAQEVEGWLNCVTRGS